MGEKVDFSQIERVSSHRLPTKREKAARHFKKFWWAYLLGLVCIIVLVVPLIIFVGIPNIAQDKLNGAKLGIDSFVLTHMRGDSFNMAFNSTIRVSGTGGIKATIDPFTAAMYLEDLEPHTPFAYVDLPKTAAKSLALVNVTQDVKIPNMEAFTVFAGWLLGKESIRVTMEGDTSFKASGISKHFGVSFKKTLDFQAVNGFKGLKVTSATISLEPDERGDNLHGWVDVPNPSILTAYIGNVTFASFVGGMNAGPAYLDNFSLSPGINNASIRAKISQEVVLGAVSQKPVCENGLLPFSLQAQNVVNHGEKLPYFINSLGASNLTVTLDIREMLQRDLNMTLSCGDANE